VKLVLCSIFLLDTRSVVSASFKGGDASVSSADIIKLTTNQGAPNGPTTVTEDLQYNG